MLEDLGLTTYEERAYISLLKRGPLPARELSKYSDVPYGRIYEVLHALEAKGLASSMGGRPQQFFAIQPDIAINKLVEARMKELENIKKNADIIVNKLNRMHQHVSENELMWKVAIGNTLFESYFSFMKDAKVEYLAYMDIQDNIKKKRNLSTSLSNTRKLLLIWSDKELRFVC